MAFKAGDADNWVVADSEDEDSFDLGEQPPRIEFNVPQTVSPIETPLSVEAAKDAIATHSTISTFTNPQPEPAGNSTISSYTPNAQSSNPPKARPRPRPIFKGSKSGSTAPTSDATSLILRTPSSERMPPPTVIVNNNSIPPTIPDKVFGAADFSLDIAERAKMRSRNAKKPLQREEVIELTSDEEMPAPPPKPKAKPRPRPVKRAKVDHPNPGDVSIAESAATTIPVASSSFPLPPSDPYTSSPEKRAEILAGLDSPAKQNTVQERKRMNIPRIQRESDGGIAGPAGVPMDVDRETTAPPPPPPFFAPSTEEPGPSNLEDDSPPVSSEKSKKAKKGAKKGTDEGATKAKPKAKASKAASKQMQVEVLIETSPKKANKSSKTVDHQAEGSLPKPVSSSASKKKPVSKKRRRVDDSDSELSAIDDSEEDELQLVPASKTKAKKPVSWKAASVATKDTKGKGKAAPVDEDPQATGQKRARSGRGVVLSDEEDAEEVVQVAPSRKRSSQATNKDKRSNDTDDAELAQREDSDARPLGKGKDKPDAPETPARSKENVSPESSNGSGAADARPSSSTKEMTSSATGRKYTFSRPSKPTPMQELIRRANSHPNSPFTPSPRASYHSPLAKTSKSLLRKIAPLHPNRKSPPPPLPPPPPPKKSKKMLQLEEKWEMELEESVEGWFALSDAERKEWRRAKRDKELGFDD
ncbi:hypothetical protein DENSPDRAFT_869186 [Dentipellis sp. KUC8613]|nr:hypothetical protein DENSPDRAFT_869186 [Dentipellis sp. KUC8613]